jgi:hypothetical protein
MGWITVLRLLLSLLGTVADAVRDRQLLSAGEAKATAKSLAALADRLAIGRAVEAEIAALTDQQARDELKEDAR